MTPEQEAQLRENLQKFNQGLVDLRKGCGYIFIIIFALVLTALTGAVVLIWRNALA